MAGAASDEEANAAGYKAKRDAMTADLKRAQDRALELRKKNRGGAASLPSDYLFITRNGKAYTKESFKTLWATVRRRLSLAPRELPSMTCGPRQGAMPSPTWWQQELLHHADPKITKRVYRRKVPSSIPLPSAVKGRNAV